jgi:anti-sigma28 factor (negative regulator of flagellin synthesis)
MQIKSNVLSLSAAAGQSSTGGASRSAGVRAAAAGAGDRVQISSCAPGLAADESRLERLRAAYESGTYHVSASQIAASIIDDELQG